MLSSNVMSYIMMCKSLVNGITVKSESTVFLGPSGSFTVVTSVKLSSYGRFSKSEFNHHTESRALVFFVLTLCTIWLFLCVRTHACVTERGWAEPLLKQCSLRTALSAVWGPASFPSTPMSWPNYRRKYRRAELTLSPAISAINSIFLC